ncbi:MAG: RidA family protein [Phycisphaeraceae bacterium]|nr:RidA family protein [Phycisphaeraceae bacterium]
MDIHQALVRLGLKLPTPPKPVAVYVPSVRSGTLIFISGQLPLVDGRLELTGRLGESVSLEEGKQAARTAALNGLAVLDAELSGDWSKLVRLVRIGVYVACMPTFRDHPQVANGASEFLGSVLGEAGRHARAAVGCPSLPLGAPVEVELLAEVAP